MKKAVLAVILFALLVVSAFSGFWLVNHFLESKKQADLFASLGEQAALDTKEESISESDASSAPDGNPILDVLQGMIQDGSSTSVPERHDTEGLRLRSADCIGWISIPGTGIDYPVMHTPDEPERYLHRNFSGEYSDYGTPFLDARCTVDAEHLPYSGNLILYGHNMFDGSMFTPLLNYTDRDYLESHKGIQLEVGEEVRRYEVFAAFQTSAKEPEIYKYVNVSGIQGSSAFLEAIQAECPYSISAEPEENAQYITLSTCDVTREGGRIVVIGRRTA